MANRINIDNNTCFLCKKCSCKSNCCLPMRYKLVKINTGGIEFLLCKKCVENFNKISGFMDLLTE